jgi:RNA polymerase-interacting CarD/CdnL/TRCF family regulator
VGGEQARQVQDKALAAAPANAAGQAAAGPGPTNVAAMLAAPKLIRTAQVTLQVDSWDAASQRLTALVTASGGYVADTQVARGDNDRRRGSITVRVPAERFADVLSGLRGLGSVELENVSAQDVTKAYADLETRLSVKRQTAARLEQILKDRTAGLADVLSVERELARLTEEIEQMEGERRFYDQQVALSTLTVNLHEPEAITHRGALAPLSEALGDAAEVASRSVAALVYLTAALLPWLIVAFVLWKVARASLRRRKRAAPAAS